MCLSSASNHGGMRRAHTAVLEVTGQTGFYSAPKESSFHFWQQWGFSRQVLRFGCTFDIHRPAEESITPMTEAAYSGFH